MNKIEFVRYCTKVFSVANTNNGKEHQAVFHARNSAFGYSSDDWISIKWSDAAVKAGIVFG